MHPARIHVCLSLARMLVRCVPRSTSVLFARFMLVALAALCLAGASTRADDLTWTGLGDGLTFSQASNWSPPRVPGPGDSCFVPADAGAPLIQFSGTLTIHHLSTARAVQIGPCGTLTVSGGVELLNAATITIDNTQCNSPGLIFAGTEQSISGNGVISLIRPATRTIEVDQGIVTIGPDATVTTGPAASPASVGVLVRPGANLINEGLIRSNVWQRTLIIQADGFFANDGLLLTTGATKTDISLRGTMNASDVGAVEQRGGVVTLPNLHGGTLTPTVDGQPYVVDENVTWTNLTLGAPISLTLCRTITIDGDLTILPGVDLDARSTEPCTAPSILVHAGEHWFRGAGRLIPRHSGQGLFLTAGAHVHTETGFSIVGEFSQGGSLIIEAVQGARLTNHGTIVATSSTSTTGTVRILGAGSFVNNGLLYAGGRCTVQPQIPMNTITLGRIWRESADSFVHLPSLTGGYLGPPQDGLPYTAVGAAWTDVTLAHPLTLICGSVAIINSLTLLNDITIDTGSRVSTSLCSSPGALIASTGGQVFILGNGTILLNKSSLRGAGLFLNNDTHLIIAPGISLLAEPDYNHDAQMNILAGNRLTNYGRIVHSRPGRSLIITNAGTFENLGTFEARAGTVAITITNLVNYDATTHTLTAGTWIASGGVMNFGTRRPKTLGEGAAMHLSTLPTGGMYDFERIEGTLRLNGRAFAITPATGLLTVNGTLELSAGEGIAGSLDVVGDVLLGESSTLRFGVAGLEPAQHGSLAASGHITISGEIGGKIEPGFEPPAASSIESVIASLIDGDFGPACFDHHPAGWGAFLVPGAESLWLALSAAAPTKPLFLEQPAVTHGCLDGSAVIEAVASPGDVTMRWHFNGAPLSNGPDAFSGVISGADDATLVISGAKAAHTGMYTLVVANDCGEIISEPAPLTLCACRDCPADFNSDGGIDGEDIDAFYMTWEAGDCEADVNRDGGVDGEDVRVFFLAWENGGC